jgi:hypothetical protein
MHIKDLYSVIVTDKRVECRDFYTRWFGFHVVFEASWFVYRLGTTHWVSPSWRQIILLSLRVLRGSMAKGCSSRSRSRTPLRSSSASLGAAYQWRTHCVMSPGVNDASLCTIHQTRGLMSSSRSTQRLDSGTNISLEERAAQQAHVAVGASRRG